MSQQSIKITEHISKYGTNIRPKEWLFSWNSNINKFWEIKIVPIIEDFKKALNNFIDQNWTTFCKKTTSWDIENILEWTDIEKDTITKEWLRLLFDDLIIKWKSIETMFNKAKKDKKEADFLPIIVVYKDGKIEFVNHWYLEKTGFENQINITELAWVNIIQENWKVINLLTETLYYWKHKDNVYSNVPLLTWKYWYSDKVFGIGSLWLLKLISWYSNWLISGKWGSIRLWMDVTSELLDLLVGNERRDIIRKLKKESIWLTELQEKELYINHTIKILKDYYKPLQAMEYDDFLVHEIMIILEKELNVIFSAHWLFNIEDTSNLIARYAVIKNNKNVQELLLKLKEWWDKSKIDTKIVKEMQAIFADIIKKCTIEELINTYEIQLKSSKIEITTIKNNLIYLFSRLNNFSSFQKQSLNSENEELKANAKDLKFLWKLLFEKMDKESSEYLNENYWQRNIKWDSFDFCKKMEILYDVTKNDFGINIKTNPTLNSYYETLLLVWEMWDSIFNKWPFVMTIWKWNKLLLTNSIYTSVLWYTKEEINNWADIFKCCKGRVKSKLDSLSETRQYVETFEYESKDKKIVYIKFLTTLIHDDDWEYYTFRIWKILPDIDKYKLNKWIIKNLFS